MLAFLFKIVVRNLLLNLHPSRVLVESTCVQLSEFCENFSSVIFAIIMHDFYSLSQASAGSDFI